MILTCLVFSNFTFTFTTTLLIVTTEYIYHNPLREEIGDIVKNTITEHNDIYGYNP